MQLLIKILPFCLRKSTSSLFYQMSSLAVRVNEELSDEEWTGSPRGGLRPWVVVVEAAEGKFSIAAAYWGLELMSLPTNAACHQNPIELLVWTSPAQETSSLGFTQITWRQVSEWMGRVMSGSTAGSGASWQVQLVDVQIFGGRNVYPTFSACLLLSGRIRLRNQTQLDGLFSQSRARRRRKWSSSTACNLHWEVW